jgi:hypothetical protein
MPADQPMAQFIVWRLRGVVYLCVRVNPGDAFVQTLKRLENL